MAGGARVRVSTVVRWWIWEPEGEETMGDRCGLAGLLGKLDAEGEVKRDVWTDVTLTGLGLGYEFGLGLAQKISPLPIRLPGSSYLPFTKKKNSPTKFVKRSAILRTHPHSLLCAYLS
jgi:hypothetical protein